MRSVVHKYDKVQTRCNRGHKKLSFAEVSLVRHNEPPPRICQQMGLFRPRLCEDHDGFWLDVRPSNQKQFEQSSCPASLSIMNFVTCPEGEFPRVELSRPLRNRQSAVYVIILTRKGTSGAKLLSNTLRCT